MTVANRLPAARTGEDRIGLQPSSSGAVDGSSLLEDGPPQITFVRPIPGFAGLTQFVLFRPSGDDSPLLELRSLDRPEVRFVVAAPSVFFSDYAIELDQLDCDHLGLTQAQDALILTVLTVGSDAASSTANLLAPVVINTRTWDAAQVILTGSDWPVRAPLG